MNRPVVKNAAFILCGVLTWAAAFECAAQEETAAEEELWQTESIRETEEEPGEEAELLRIRFAADAQEIYDALKKTEEPLWLYDDLVEYAMEDADASAGSTKTMNTDTVSAQDHSEVNVRQEGVDEADVIRTDGKYIYILRSDGTLSIVDTSQGSLKETALITLPKEEGNINSGEIFLGDNCLQIIEDRDYYDYDSDGVPYCAETILYTYDLTDIASPVLAGTYRQDGYYQEARKKDGKIYLFSKWKPVVGNSITGSVLTPKVAGKELDPKNVCIPDIRTSREFLVVSSVDEKEPENCTDAKALISGSDLLYVSDSSIYVLNRDYASSRTRTEITKFSYADGKIKGVAAGRVRGTVEESFWIDEYNGDLRVLTTYTGKAQVSIVDVISDLFDLDYYDPERYVDHNALYILDEKMRQRSSIKDLAPEERMRSARYFGDTAYFVTFRNTDPLFTADLSDPDHPQIIGELTIPGFSDYLHPFGEDKLLGAGFTADPDTGILEGLKLSVYDISNPMDVTESDITTIDGITYLPALNDYKAFLVSPERQLIGFWINDRYFVYTLSEEGEFVRSLHYDFYEDGLQDRCGYEEVRGLFIGTTFYLAGPEFVVSFDMNDGFKKMDVLRLEEVL